MNKKRKKLVSWKEKKKRAAYCFIAPFMIGMIIFLCIPVGTSLLYSLSQLKVNTTGYELEFVGFSNYYKLLFIDPIYRKILVSSLMELTNVPIVIIFSFFIASVLNQKFKGRGLARVIFFLPVIFSSGVYIRLENMDQMAAQVSLTQSESGGGMATAFIDILTLINMPEGLINMIETSVNQIDVIVSMSAIPIVIFLAAFQAISPSIFEAAYMEGCTKWETFWKISFPMISPQILVCVIYSIVDNFTKSSSTMIKLVHGTIFTQFQFGEGTAMIWIFVVMVLLIIAAVYALLNKYIFYYD